MEFRKTTASVSASTAPLLGRAASVPPLQLRSRYLGSPFPCHLPIHPVAWVCSLQLRNPCETFHWQTPGLDTEQLNLFDQFLKTANFLCTCFGIPEIKKSRSLTKHFTLTCLNRTGGNFLVFSSNTCCEKGLGWSLSNTPLRLLPTGQSPSSTPARHTGMCPGRCS